MSSLFKRVRPDMVVVQGDTTTAFAAALAASLQEIPVAHVEAGLRTGRFDSPYPEELNRVFVDRVSALHFAPTSNAKKNLMKESIDPKGIFVTGNTVVDAMKKARVPKKSPLLDKLVDPEKPFILATTHRRENFGRPLERIFRAFMILARRRGATILYPVHPNPSVRKAASRLLRHPGIVLAPPIPYPDFLSAMKKCAFILTDSGGIVEEAPSFGKPVLILRETTERPEAVWARTAKLVGTETGAIVKAAENLIRNGALSGRRKKTARRNPFGDGRAGGRIARIIARRFGLLS